MLATVLNIVHFTLAAGTKQLLNNTTVALAVMIVAAIVIWAFDQLASAGIQALITITG